jgi:hypothetical protein
MEKAVKQDILTVLKQGVAALNKNDTFKIKELSNQVIHNASIFQDEDSLGIAVLMYSLSKIAGRKNFETKKIVSILVKASVLLQKSDYGLYRKTIKQALKSISSSDSRLKFFVGTVIEQAQIKKACKVCLHGVSVGRTAEMFGISKWELMRYLGKTTFQESMPEKIGAIDRLELARGVFNK